MTLRRRVALGYAAMLALMLAVTAIQTLAVRRSDEVQASLNAYVQQLRSRVQPGVAVTPIAGHASRAPGPAANLQRAVNRQPPWTLPWRLDLLTRQVFIASVLLCVVAGILAIYFSTVLWRRLDRWLVLLQGGIRTLAEGAWDAAIEYPWNDEFRQCAESFNRMAAQLREHARLLTRMANRDPLTDLLNRRMFIEQLVHETEVARQTGRPLSLIMVDLDHFKQINDRYGHSFGDRVLTHIGARFRSLVRESDHVGRLGGEELTILLPGVPLAEAANVARDLRTSLACEELPCGSEAVRLAASFGVVQLDLQGDESPDDLLRRADRALYAAKQRGRDMVVAMDSASADQQPAESQPRRPDLQRWQDDQAAQQRIALDRDTLALMGSMFTLLHLMPDKKRVAADLVDQVTAVLECERVTLLLLDRHSNELFVAAARGLPDQGGSVRIPVVGSVFEAVGDPDQTDKTNWHRMPPDLVIRPGKDGPDQEVTYLPLVLHGEPLGLIVATGRNSDGPISKRQRTILRALGAVGAVALKNCNLYTDLEEQWIGSIRALSSAIDANDPYTCNHSARVACLAVRIGKAMGIRDDAELRTLQLAGLLHDIGKIGIPGQLLQKSRRLRSREYQAIQQHCLIGARILQKMPRLSDAAAAVMHHHEWFNGRGYPQGLAGEQIPLASRILAVADAFDAMTSQRSYRASMRPGEAVHRIHARAGTQFDPAVVQAFLEAVRSEAPAEPQTLLGQARLSTEQVLAVAS